LLKHGNSALHIIAADLQGPLEILEYLAKEHISPTKSFNAKGQSAIDVALDYENREAYRVLTGEEGANPEEQQQNQQ
jgi:hypothetical protein